MQKILLALTILTTALSAFAQDKQTLDLLVSKGIISRQEADELSKKSTLAVEPSRKKAQSLKLIGRAQTQFENIGTRENVGGISRSLETKNDILLRRVFLGVEADLGAGWSGTIIADFMRSSANYLEYAYVSKQVDTELVKGVADIGYKKVMFNLEEYSSSSKMSTIERSIASRYFSEGVNGRRLGLGGRHTGVFWQGEIPNAPYLKYGASITNSYNNNPTSAPQNASNEFLYATNIAYVRTFENSVSVNFGANFIYSNSVNTDASLGQNGATSTKGEMFGVNPYIKISAKNIDFWSELLLANIENARTNFSQSATPWGINIGVEYKFDVGEIGKLGAVARASYLDTDGRGIKMSDGVRNSASNATFDSGWSVYVGLNWYIIGDDLKLQFGYEHTRLDDSPTSSSQKQHSSSNAIRTQLQLLF